VTSQLDKAAHWRQFRLLGDVERFRAEVRAIPMRAQGGTHPDEDRYAAGLYLLWLGRHGLLSYPFGLDQGESPDFMLTWQSGETSGLEVTRATTGAFQKVMSELDRESIRRDKEAKAKGVEPDVASVDWDISSDSDERVHKWCDQMLQAIRRKLEKLPKYRVATYHDLVIHQDTSEPIFPGNERREALRALAPVKDLQFQFPQRFHTISIITSSDVEYDIARKVSRGRGDRLVQGLRAIDHN
jgi:hypothetical protein